MMMMKTDERTTQRAQLRAADWITVLNDDETYTSLEGCWIAVTTPEVSQKLDDGDDPNDIPELVRWDLDALVQCAIDHGYFD
jgi:hypothetical protein